MRITCSQSRTKHSKFVCLFVMLSFFPGLNSCFANCLISSPFLQWERFTYLLTISLKSTIDTVDRLAQGCLFVWVAYLSEFICCISIKKSLSFQSSRELIERFPINLLPRTFWDRMGKDRVIQSLPAYSVVRYELEPGPLKF